MTNEDFTVMERVLESKLDMKRDRYKTNHSFHALMVILTLGLWVLAWVIACSHNRTMLSDCVEAKDFLVSRMAESGRTDLKVWAKSDRLIKRALYRLSYL